MIEDQLTRDERIRLECLNQAVASKTMTSSTPLDIIDTAKKFEGYIREEEPNATK